MSDTKKRKQPILHRVRSYFRGKGSSKPEPKIIKELPKPKPIDKKEQITYKIGGGNPKLFIIKDPPKINPNPTLLKYRIVENVKDGFKISPYIIDELGKDFRYNLDNYRSISMIIPKVLIDKYPNGAVVALLVMTTIKHHLDRIGLKIESVPINDLCIMAQWMFNDYFNYRKISPYVVVYAPELRKK